MATPKTTRPIHWYWLFFSFTLLMVLFQLFQKPHLWYLAIGPLHSPKLILYPFADMDARLGMAQGIANGIDVNREVNPYSRNTHLNNKPLYTIKLMAALGWDRTHRIPLGIAFCAFFTAWLLWMLRPKSLLQVAVMLAAALSPPILLLYERANDDIIVFCIACFAAAALPASSFPRALFSWALISFVLPMKYYPAAAYALLIQGSKTWLKPLFFVGLSAVYLTVLWFMIQGELETLSERIPRPETSASFGATLLFESLQLNEWPTQTIALSLFSFFGLGALLLIRLKNIELPEENSRNEALFILGFSMAAFCFLANSNWDYRMVFLLPTLPLVLSWMGTESMLIRWPSALFLIGLFGALWPEYLYFHSALDYETGWQFQASEYRRILVLKHAASWICIGSGLVLAVHLTILRSPLFTSLIREEASNGEQNLPSN